MSDEEVWLVRHGQTEWSAAGRHTSRTDLELTDTGVAQARSVRPRLDGVDFDRVLTSPLRRAWRTAELAGFPDAVVDTSLREWDYGEYEGRTTAAIRERVPGWTVWTHPAPGGDTAESMAGRFDDVVSRLRERRGRTLIFGHGHALRVLAVRWLGLRTEAGALFWLDTGTVSVLGYEHESPTVVRWNA